MKVTKDQAAANRAAVVDAASRLFRDHGFAGVNLGQITAAAGLTNGGFYRQFDSKESLFAEACARALAEVAQLKSNVLAKPGGRQRFRKAYLGKQQVEGEAFCPAVTVGADVSRADRQVQAVFAEGLRQLIAAGQDAGSDGSKREMAEMATLTGAVLMARAVHKADPALAEQILDAALASISAGHRDEAKTRE